MGLLWSFGGGKRLAVGLAVVIASPSVCKRISGLCQYSSLGPIAIKQHYHPLIR